MKTTSILKAMAFTALVSADRALYRALCPSRNNSPGSYDNGNYQVHYTCDYNGLMTSLLGDPQSADDPEACALLCRATSGCQGSAWLYGGPECYLFRDGAPDSGRRVTGAVFMRRDTPEEPAPEPEETDGDGDCANELQDCQGERDNLRDDLAESQRDRETCEAELARRPTADALDECNETLEQARSSCAARTTTLQGQLSTCQASRENPAWTRRRQAMEVCGYGGRSRITAGRYTYTSHCGRYAAYGTFYRQETLGVDDCLRACTADARCKAVNFMITADAHCKMYDNGSTQPIAVVDEASCPGSLVVGFVPTTAK